jgi:hypothetical protein
MSNQLAETKRRKSLAEHVAVLAALEEIARNDGVSVMDLMRQAVRGIVKKYTANSSNKKILLPIVMRFAPKIPQQFDSFAQITRFKKQQREFDQILLDLHLDNSEAVEERNSIVSPHCNLRILEWE